MRAGALASILALLLVSAALGQSATITPSTANCGINDASVNTCVAYVQALLKGAGCSASCSLHFTAGTYYLFVARYAYPVWYAPATAALFNVTGPAPTAASQGAPSTLFVLSDIANLLYVQPSSYTQTYIADITVDMARVPFTYGIATSSTTFSIPAWVLQDPVFRIDVAAYPWLGQAQAINSYFAAQGRWTGDLDDYMLAGPTASIRYSPVQADGSITGTVAFVNGVSFAHVVGQYVILRHRVYNYQMLTVVGYADLTVRRVDLYATGGMGIVCIRCGAIDVDGFRISPPRGSPAVPPGLGYRPVSITADGLHVENQRIGSLFRLVNSHIEAQGDDCVNVNTAMASVTSIAGTTITAAGYGNGFPFEQGDTVNLINGANAQFRQQQGGCQFDARTLAITCPQAWVGAAVGDLVYCASCIAEGTVANNYFGRNRARGVLLRGLGFTVQANVFDRNSGPAFFAPIDGCTFFEGPLLYNLNFVQNSVVSVNAGPGMQYGAVALVPQVRAYRNGVPVPNTCIDSPVQVFINISIASNTFIHDVYFNTPQPTTFVADANPVAVTGNNISRYAMPQPPCELLCQTCGGLSESGNTCNGGACTECS